MNTRTKTALALVIAGVLAIGTVTSATASDVTMPRSTADRTMPHIEIGVPGEDLGDQRDAGAVEVRYSGGTTKSLVAPDHAAGDRFGSATIAYDIDADNRQDLFVGAPGKDVGHHVDAGAIYVFRGTPNGLAYWKTYTMNSFGDDMSAQTGAGFGATMARDWVQGDTPSNRWLMIGAPTYDVNLAENAGAVVEIGIGQGDQPSIGGNLWTAADWPGGEPRTGDRFGAALAENDLLRAIGAPGKKVDGAPDAGAIYFTALTTTGTQQILTQNSQAMPGSAEADDRFGSALLMNWDRLYVGTPGEDVGDRADAGLVQAVELEGWEEPTVPGPAFTQNSVDDVTGLPLAGSAEAGDRFGSALAWYAVDFDGSYDRQSHIHIGVPGEDTGSASGSASNAGMVNVLHDAERPGLTNGALGGRNEPGNRFGTSVYARMIDFPTVAIGVPGASGGSGAVRLVEPRTDSWWQITGAREAGDGYGASIGGSL